MKPLEGLIVLEFCQYLAGPLAGLRLADLGARVIKIERPVKGEACRALAIKNLFVDGDSLLFHTINRNKESYAADLKNPDDLALVRKLIARADVMTHNFRPGVMEKIGLDYEQARGINPRLVYGIVTGYGNEGPWAAKPGQDLLIQALSGLTWLSGDRDDGPVPFGIAVADIFCGNHLAQGILAALARRGRTGEGALVEVSLMESILDVQFEVLTTHLNDGGKLPRRAAQGNAHAYLAAPYGVYRTSDGWLALAMGDLTRLREAIGCEALDAFGDRADTFARRDEIMAILRDYFAEHPTDHWLGLVERRGVWASDVFGYGQSMSHEAIRAARMEQTIQRGGEQVRTLRCPLRIDGERLFAARPAPRVGEHNAAIQGEPETTAPLPFPHSAFRNPHSQKPLDGILVVDLSQFLSGPSASLRLADLGARVIKIEKPGEGDLCRRLYVSDVELNGASTVFHAINRNKESFAAFLKNAADLARVRKLIERADVVMHNFRPGVIERLGLDHATVHALNPRIVYGAISGYGDEGPWKDNPGQDLLLQSLAGLTWLSGNADDGPAPMGLSVVDMLAGAHLAQGILALLVRRGITGEGGRVEVNMLESALDFQFETLTTFLRDGEEPQRTAVNNAHAYVAAPYGIYATADGWLAMAMGSIPQLGRLLECPALEAYEEPARWFDERDAIKRALAEYLKTRATADWLSVLEPADIWCADVLDWNRLLAHDGFKALEMIQEVAMGDGFRHRTTRCPIRIDGQRLLSAQGSPAIGEHTAALCEEFGA
jgi:crotonobetainyl-CoA:carnitine CoA-transferase CaiB-like acyl-CoA transferase